MSTDLRAVLASGARPGRPGPVSASLTFGWRAVLKIKHVPEQLFDVTGFPVMIMLTFTYLFGGAIAGSTEVYLRYLLPGIMVMGVLMTTMYLGVALNIDVREGIFDRIRTLPLWRPSALVGPLLGDLLRYTLACLVMITVGLVLGYRPDGGALGVLLAVLLLLLFSFSFSWIWALIGLLVRSEKSVQSLSMALMLPLMFLSSTFANPATMPSWLRAFVEVSPITRLVDAMRGLMNGGVNGNDVWFVLLSCVVLTAVFGGLTMRRYRRP